MRKFVMLGMFICAKGIADVPALENEDIRFDLCLIADEVTIPSIPVDCSTITEEELIVIYANICL